MPLQKLALLLFISLSNPFLVSKALRVSPAALPPSRAIFLLSKKVSGAFYLEISEVVASALDLIVLSHFAHTSFPV